MDPDSLTKLLNIDPDVVKKYFQTDFQNQLDEAFEKEYKACLLWNIWKNTRYISEEKNFDIKESYNAISGYVDIFRGKHIGVDFSNIDEKLSLCYFNIFNMDENSIELFNKITVDSIVFGVVMYRSISVLKYENVENFLISHGFELKIISNTDSHEYRAYILKKYDLTYQIYTKKNYINFTIRIGVHDKQCIEKNIKFIFDDCKLLYSN